jgi:FG-GAP-like repeat/Kre9/KNH-like N-terminal Ig-like domain
MRLPGNEPNLKLLKGFIKVKTKITFLTIITGFFFTTILHAQVSFNEQGIGFTGVSYGAVEFGDFDADGDLDFLIFGQSSDGNKGLIYVNTGNGFDKDSVIVLSIEAWSVDAKWFDYDNDGDLDILLSGDSFGGLTQLLINNENFFSEAPLSFFNVKYSAVDWGDYDNDGDLDLIYTGLTSTDFSRPIKIYLNNDLTFADTGIELDGAEYGDLEWMDYDNDGDLDIFVTGSNGGRNSTLYKKDPSGYIDTGFSFPDYLNAASDWGDFDQDGDLDLVICGNKPGQETVVYRNNQTGFEVFATNLVGIEKGDVKWADFDNDGDLDIILSGNSTSGNVTKVYTNDGSTFTDAAVALVGLKNTAIAVGDYDNDRDVDFILSGWDVNGDYFTLLYSNNATDKNTSPNRPINLSQAIDAGNITFMWEGTGDAETSSAGITFNLRVGTSPGGQDVIASHTTPIIDKFMLSKRGNREHNSNYVLNGLKPGTYYWAVQSVDNSFATSSFSTEQNFELTGPPVIEITSPNGGEIWAIGGTFTIQWNDNIGNNVKIELFKGASFDSEITSSTASDGEFDWTIPSALVPDTDYKIKITDIFDNLITDVSDDFFEIASTPSVTVAAPNGGEVLIIGAEYNIDFSSTHESDFKIEYQWEPGTNWIFLTTINSTSGNSSYPWTIPNTPSANCLVKVSDLNTPTIFDESDAVFTIQTGPLLTLHQPNGGENLVAGDDYNIRWTSRDVANISIFYSTNGGASWAEITNSVPAADSALIWSVPNTPSTQCLVRIEDRTDNSILDISKAVFEISPPPSDNDNPRIGEPDYSDNEPINEDHIVTVTITDASPLSTVKLFFKKGGATNFNSVNMQNTGGDNYSGTIPASSLTATGILFYIFAVDEFLNDSISDTNSIQLVVPNGITLPGGVKAGSTVFDYKLFSVPLDIGDKPMSQFLQINTDFGSDVDWESFRLFGLRSGDTELKEYPDVDNIIPGRAYFLLSSDDKTMSSGLGKTVDISGSYSIPVPQGWSLIGNPFNFRVPYDSLYTNPPVNFVLRSFDGDWPLNQSGLEPWQGYALWVENATTFKISPGPDNLGKSPAFYTTENNSADEWLIRIKAKNGKSVSDFNFIGQQFAASDGIDKLDLRTPPRFQKQVVLSFKNDADEKIASDIRATNPDGHSWEFTCYTNPDEEVLSLSFSGLPKIEGQEIILYDQKTRNAYNLKQQQKITFAVKGLSQKDFNLVVGTQSFLESLNLNNEIFPTDFELKPAFPNPFNPVTQLNYSIVREGHVSLGVYNLLGQKISTLVDSNLPKGNYTAVWQAQNASSGIYLFKLTMGKNVQIQRALLIK